MQEAYFRSHARSVIQRVQIRQGLLIDVCNHHPFYTHSTVYKKQWALDQLSLIQQNFMLFTCVAPHTNSKGLPIDSLLAKTYVFYTRSTAYKKQETPDQRSLTQ
jgi:hypothetical protein